jgi:MFS family permease
MVCPAGRGSRDVGTLPGRTQGLGLITEPLLSDLKIGRLDYATLNLWAIGLFNESILAERGFGPSIYYQTLAVTAMTALAGNFIGGWLAVIVPLNRLMAISLFVFAGGLLWLPHVTTPLQVMLWATSMGLGGGLVMVLFFSVWARFYGRRQLGRIQGVAQALTVVASAAGPLLLAACVEWTGSYRVMFYALGATVGVFGFAALIVPLPPPPEGIQRGKS